MKNLRLTNVFLPLAALAFATSANATVIDWTATGPAGGLYVNSSSVVTGNPGNGYNGPWQTDNTLSYDEDFTGPGKGWATFLHVDYPTATEYSVTQDVKNTSSLPWTDFHIYVGDKTMEQPIYTNWFTIGTGFVPTITGPGTLGASLSLLPDNNWITWTGLNVQPGATVEMQFNLDLMANMHGGWEIQQQASYVPEPASLSCFALGAPLLLRGRNRRRFLSPSTALSFSTSAHS